MLWAAVVEMGIWLLPMAEVMKINTIRVYGRKYEVEVIRHTALPECAPRLVIVSYQPNEDARRLLRLSIESIRKYTSEPYELWVIDNASDLEMSRWLEFESDLNVIFNRTPPVETRPFWSRYLRPVHSYAGSYANAVALELAARCIDPGSRYMMTLHMDTVACHKDWLGFLKSHLTDRVRCVGMRMDTTRTRTIHVLGMLFDFSLFNSLNLSFAHDMPRHDVGDGIPLGFQSAGFEIWACRNSLWNPELLDLLPNDSRFRDLRADRSFNDANEVIFMHLGRGVNKSAGCTVEERSSLDAWLSFGSEMVLQR